MAHLPHLTHIDGLDGDMYRGDWDVMLQIRRDMFASHGSNNKPALLIHIYVDQPNDRIERCLPSITNTTPVSNKHHPCTSGDARALMACIHSMYAAVDPSVRIFVPVTKYVTLTHMLHLLLLLLCVCAAVCCMCHVVMW